jgi:hypothetical protein
VKSWNALSGLPLDNACAYRRSVITKQEYLKRAFLLRRPRKQKAQAVDMPTVLPLTHCDQASGTKPTAALCPFDLLRYGNSGFSKQAAAKITKNPAEQLLQLLRIPVHPKSASVLDDYVPYRLLKEAGYANIEDGAMLCGTSTPTAAPVSDPFDLQAIKAAQLLAAAVQRHMAVAPCTAVAADTAKKAAVLPNTAQPSGLGAVAPATAGLGGVASPMAPQPGGSAVGADTASVMDLLARRPQPAVLAASTTMAPGPTGKANQSPNQHPIQSYGGISTTGNINGNASFGVKNNVV